MDAAQRSREDRLIEAMRVVLGDQPSPLTSEWCSCEGDPGFRCYPGDGECSCGMIRHHVHGLCGHVIQVG